MDEKESVEMTGHICRSLLGQVCVLRSVSQANCPLTEDNECISFLTALNSAHFGLFCSKKRLRLNLLPPAGEQAIPSLP